ncbi:MAG: hypothetical protein ACLQVJ_26445 [Syntrophobacteraceae bacterium]
MAKGPTDKESKVARSLRGGGAKVQVPKKGTAGSDLVAKFPSGTVWNVEVKSRIAGKDVAHTKPTSSGNKTKVLAKVSAQGIEYESAKSGRKLTPPKPKKR